jgi:hypothetical protein
MRGAGSSFGIATKFTMQTQPAPANGVSFTYSWPAIKDDSLDLKISVFSTVQDYGAATAPPELALRLWAMPDVFAVMGVYWGTRGDFDDVMAPLLQKWPKNPTVSIEELGWLDSLSAFNGGVELAQPEEYTQHDTFYVKSIVAPEKIKPTALNSFFGFLSSQRAREADVQWWVITGELQSTLVVIQPNVNHQICMEACTPKSATSLSTRPVMLLATPSGRYSYIHTRPASCRHIPRILFLSWQIWRRA